MEMYESNSEIERLVQQEKLCWVQFVQTDLKLPDGLWGFFFLPDLNVLFNDRDIK